tara:strand:- start:109419 stop:109688 length:270 start_codon:yes stop_codon:yes gene_type:complete
MSDEHCISASLYKDSEGDDSPPIKDFQFNHGDPPEVDPLIEIERQKRLSEVYADPDLSDEDHGYWRGRVDGLDQLERFVNCGEIQPLED